ncbi:MAG: DOMON domain-containing protein [Spirochaetaceae bacterium]
MKFNIYRNIGLLLFLTLITTNLIAKSNNETAITEGETQLNDDGTKTIIVSGITFTWKIDGEYLYGTLESKYTGWIAIGINPKNMMQEADFVIGYVSDGVVNIRDDYGNWLTSHAADEELGGTNDVEAITGSENEDGTRFEFKRKIISTDEFDNTITLGVETPVIFATGKIDDYNSMHTVKGKGIIVF